VARPGPGGARRQLFPSPYQCCHVAGPFSELLYGLIQLLHVHFFRIGLPSRERAPIRFFAYLYQLGRVKRTKQPRYGRTSRMSENQGFYSYECSQGAPGGQPGPSTNLLPSLSILPPNRPLWRYSSRPRSCSRFLVSNKGSPELIYRPLCRRQRGFLPEFLCLALSLLLGALPGRPVFSPPVGSKAESPLFFRLMRITSTLGNDARLANSSSESTPSRRATQSRAIRS
jgi:hypothetical protein